MVAQILGPALAGIARSMFGSYSRAAFTSYNATKIAGLRNNVNIGDFNALEILQTSTGAAGIDIANLTDLQQTLKDVAPELYRKLNRDLKKVGQPAQEKVQEAYRQINSNGPLGGPQKGRANRTYDRMANSEIGRLSWVNSKTLNPKAAVSLNFRNRNKARDLAYLRSGKDATLSIVRVSVNAPAFVLADIAGSGNGSGAIPAGQRTRKYQINLFGRGIITRDHVMTQKRINQIWNKWIPALNDKKKPPKASRYAWPAVDDHMPKYLRNTEAVLNPVIAELNRRMSS